MRALEGRRGGRAGPTFVVVGGAGAMGRITVRDLVELGPKEASIVIADRDETAARRLARSFGDKRVRGIFIDVDKPKAAAALLRGSFAVIGAVHHRLNLELMHACLAAGCHYADLGGLFHETRKQLKLHRQFEKKGLLALLGIGAAPGIVNVLARKACDALESVDSIDIYVGGIDRTPGREQPLLGASYSLATILEEATAKAALFDEGQLHFVEPMSGAVPVRFPEPVGEKRPAYTLHSEVATLPGSFAHKGVRRVSFRIAFTEALDERLRFLRALGLLSGEPLRVGKAQIVPQELLTRLVARLPKPAPGGPPDEHEILRVVVRGRAAGQEVERILDCHATGMPAWQVGSDVDTGCPPSICAQLLWSGELTARGVLPPELAVPVAPFLRELEKRGMRIHEV